MSEPIQLPSELRWRCRECGEDFPDERMHVAFERVDSALGICWEKPLTRENIFSQEKIESWPFSGPVERGHNVSWTTGGRAGVMGGWTQHSRVCGPLRLTEIDVQELFCERAVGGKP